MRGDGATGARRRPALRHAHAQGTHEDEIDEIVAAWAAQYPAADLTKIVEEGGVVVGPVNTVADVVADPQFQARGMLIDHHDERVSGPVLGPGVMPVLTGTPGAVKWAGPPRPGTHNVEVYGELLGLSEQQRLLQLTDEGIV